MTKTCINCGRDISEGQFDTYQGFCNNCLQSELKQMVRSDTLPYTSCRYCAKPAAITCSICGKPLCSSHIMVQKNDPNPYHGRCRDCVPRRTYSRSSGGTRISIKGIVYCIILIVVIISVIVGS